MANTAIALIIAGSGDTSDGEVEDLLNDAYPEDAWDEFGLVVPIDKDLYTDTVKHALKWFNDDENVYAIQTKGASLARGTAGISENAQQVEKFADAINKEDFKEWDEVHVLLALPADQDDPDYDFYAEIADLAIEAGFVVKDLTAGLDDIVVTDPETAGEEEPEPVKEEPKEEAPKTASRRSRAAPKAESIEEVKEAVAAPEEPKVEESEAALPHGDRIFALETEVRNLRDMLDGIAEVILAASQRTTALPDASSDPVVEAIDKIEAEKTDEPKRGRGRPRTDFDIRQVLDEDTDEWVPRPKGRLRKGTQWRTIHSESGEVLEEGTA